jgi:hypothetical protein
MATQLCQKCKQSHPMVSAIMAKKVTARRRPLSMRFLNLATSHQRKRRIEDRCDPEQSERSALTTAFRQFTSTAGGVRGSEKPTA